MAVKRHFHLLVIILVALSVLGGLEAVKLLSARKVSANKENNAPASLPLAHFFGENGESVTLDDFKGQVVLVNLWATWCPPCVAELPSLDRLQARLKEKDFKVIAISLNRSSMTDVLHFLKSGDITHLTPYWDKEREIPLHWTYQGLPTSFLIGRDGKVIRRFDGPRAWDKGDAFTEIERALQ